LQRKVTSMSGSLSVLSVLAGAAGGVASWFATDFIARPIVRFFQMRSEIVQCILYYSNVRAAASERGRVSENFTDDDMARLQEAQSKLRQLAMQMQSFAATEDIALRLVIVRGYDPLEAGRSLVGYSNSIALYGDERAKHRKSVFAALRIRNLN
jgi:hypothetical protein